MAGVRSGDCKAVGEVLTDDVKLTIHGSRSLEGKSAFLKEVENAALAGLPKLSEDRVVEEGNVVVLTGSGEADHGGGGLVRFRFCGVFVFRDGLISEIESYMVTLA